MSPSAPNPKRRRRRGLIAGGVAAAALLAGGAAVVVAQPWSRSPAAHAVSVSEAGQRTLDAKTAKAAFTITLQGGKVTQPVTLTVDAAVDFQNGAVAATTDLSALLKAVGAPSELGTGQVEVRLSDGVAYLKSSLLDMVPGASGKWLKLDLQKVAGDRLGVNIGSLTTGGLTGGLQALSAADAAQVTTVGTETIDGVTTTHQHVVVDVAKALDGKVDSAALQALLGKLGTSTVPFDVWIDGNGLVRKETLAISQAGVNVSLSASYRDIGAPVSVEPPAGADTIDLSGLLGK